MSFFAELKTERRKLEFPQSVSQRAHCGTERALLVEKLAKNAKTAARREAAGAGGGVRGWHGCHAQFTILKVKMN